MKILVVDDSIVYRTAITQALGTKPEYNVFKACSNGKIAIDFLKQNPDTDLITLDMEMPVMDGMQTIEEVRKFNKDVAIIVFSATTTRGAEKTIDALSRGADEFVTKIVDGGGSIEESVEMIRVELLPKIEALKNKRSKHKAVRESKEVESSKEELASSKMLADSYNEQMSIKPRLICIGCSTGGPEALAEVFRNIKARPKMPMLIVQHMPPVFTGKLAEMLNKISPIEVREAKEGDRIEEGVCLIAPGDYHMTITKEGVVKLNQDEKVCFVRPAVDVLYDSVAKNFNHQVLNFILTGMGEDGMNGSKMLKEKGAYTFIQDEESSVVWGMPGAVHRAGIGAKVIDLPNVGELITIIANRV